MSLDEKGIGTIETWAILEIMGHTKFAGFVRSVSIGMGAMIRIDVPEIPEEEVERERWNYETGKAEKYKQKHEKMPGFTKFFGVQSIFALTPCSEEMARTAVKSFRSIPITVLQLPALPAPRHENDEDDDEYDHTDD